MTKTLALAIGLACALTTTAPALAQTGGSPAAAATSTPPASTAAKRELVAKILKLQQPGVEAMARQLAEQPAALLFQRAGAALQGVPADKRDAIAREIEADLRKYVEETTPIVRDRAVKLAGASIGPILDERFTEDELRQIIVTLESPLNRKFQQAGPDMQRALTEKLVAETREEVQQKVRTLEQAVAQRLGMKSDAGAASASGSAPNAGAKK